MASARQDMLVILRGEVSDLKAKLNTAEREVKQLRKAALGVGTAGAKAGKQAAAGMAAVGKGAKASTAAVGGLAASVKGLTASLGLFAGVASIGLLGREVIGTVVEFRDAMAQVEIVLRPTREELELLTEAAKEMGATTLFSATEAANGLKLLGQAGFDTAKAITVLPKVLDLAVGAQLSLEAATEQTAGVLRAFGLDVSQVGEVTDALILGQNTAANTVTEFAEGLAKVGPIAKLANVSLQETTAALGLLANNMVKGSDGGTALRNVIIRLAAPAADGARAIRDLDLSLNEVNPEVVGLTEALITLRDAGLTKTGDFAAIFGKKMAASGAILVSTAGEMDELTKAVTGLGEATEAAATRMEEEISSKFELIRSQFKALILGKEDGIAGLVSGLQDLTLIAIPAFGAALAGLQAGFETVLGFASRFLEVMARIVALTPGMKALLDVADVLGFLSKNLHESAVASNEAATEYGVAALQAAGLAKKQEELSGKIAGSTKNFKEIQKVAVAALEATKEEAARASAELARLGANTSLDAMRQSLGFVNTELDEAGDSAATLGDNLDTAGGSSVELQTKAEAVQKILALLEENSEGSAAQIKQFGLQLADAIGPARDLEEPIDVVQKSLEEVAKSVGVTEEEFLAIKTLLEQAVRPITTIHTEIDATAEVAQELRDKGFGEDRIAAMIQPTESVRDALGLAADSGSELDISMDGAAASTNDTATAAGIVAMGLANANSAAQDLESTLERIRASFGGGG